MKEKNRIFLLIYTKKSNGLLYCITLSIAFDIIRFIKFARINLLDGRKSMINNRRKSRYATFVSQINPEKTIGIHI